MNLVIDTSALLAVLLNERSRNSILKNTEGKSLTAPISIDAEIGNALSAMFKRKRITLENATKLIVQYELIPIRKTPIELQDSVTLCNDLNIYAYDAYMLNCCIKYSLPLLSLDQTLIGQAENIGIKIIEV